MSKENQERELEKTFEELGVEVDLNPETELDIQTQTDLDQEGTVQAETTEITVYQPVNQHENTQNISKTLLLQDGTQLQLNVLKRPECPSCGYIPAKEGEPGHLTGSCDICQTQTCPRCKNRCESCGTIMCNSCTTGHGSTGETLCTSCLQDKDEQIQYERRLEIEKQKHQQEIDKQQEERKARNQENKEYLKKKRLQIQALKLLMQTQKLNGSKHNKENRYSVDDFHREANKFK